jgi:hypothetical protein
MPMRIHTPASNTQESHNKHHDSEDNNDIDHLPVASNARPVAPAPTVSYFRRVQAAPRVSASTKSTMKPPQP